MMLGGAAQKTGWCNSLTTPSGHTEPNGHGADANYRYAVRYRFMENLWGNVWHFIDGLNLADGKAYIRPKLETFRSKFAEKLKTKTTEEQ